MWKLAPIEWDGIIELIANFKNWWSTAIEAKHRHQGMDHLALTAIVPWNIWKAKNARDFNGKEKEPRRIITKACKEWMELTNMLKKTRNRSTAEIGVLQQNSVAASPEPNNPMQGTVKIKVAVHRQEEAGILGYGIMAEDGTNQPMLRWGLAERITGSHIQQEAEAIKLALSKVAELRETEISVEKTCKDLLDQIKGKVSKTYWMATLVQDIQAS